MLPWSRRANDESNHNSEHDGESDDSSEHGDSQVVEPEVGSTSSHEPQVICSAQCCSTDKLVQITDSRSIRSNRKQQRKKWWQFSPEWYRTYPRLLLCSTRSKVFCSYCRSSNQRGILTAKKAGGGDAFLTTGFDNWKRAHESFKQHEKSAIHKEAVLKRELMKQPSIAAQMNDQVKKSQKLHWDMLLRQLPSLMFLLRQGLVVGGHNEEEGNRKQLLSVHCEDCPSLK